jgi:hypothetical protein
MMGNNSKQLPNNNKFETEEEINNNNNLNFSSSMMDIEYKGKLNNSEAGIIPRAMNQVYIFLKFYFF